ncbi:pdgfa associated protein 1b isoform X2 [Nelusetta ayraudi]|uniref:pdgfa associated protein 1b isoform X2 n=1 Tax=Nelusetta ayraudi TaxID=303726 RepID=UPI003F72D076
MSLPLITVFTFVSTLSSPSGDYKQWSSRKGGHKGRARMYTSPEEIDAQMKAEKEKKMQEEEEGVGAAQNDTAEEKHPGSGSDDSDDDSSRRRGGVDGLIDIENPNRVTQKAKKVSQIELDEPKQLSRREREEIEKQKAKAHYMKLHYAGKTDEAKADLARLAIIRREREEAARKKEGEKKAKEAAAAASRGLHSLSLK